MGNASTSLVGILTSAPPKKAEWVLVWTSSLLLVLAAMGKLLTVASDFKILDLFDPVFLFKNKYLLTGVASIELVSAFSLLRSKRLLTNGLILLWLAINFLLYRSALALSGAETPCNCVGSVGLRLGLSSTLTESLVKAIILYFLAAGAYLVIRHRPRPRDLS